MRFKKFLPEPFAALPNQTKDGGTSGTATPRLDGADRSESGGLQLNSRQLSINLPSNTPYDRLLATLAHEVRTALTNIVGAHEMLATALELLDDDPSSSRPLARLPVQVTTSAHHDGDRIVSTSPVGDAREAADTIVSSSRYLMRLLNDIRMLGDLQQAGNGDVELLSQPFSVADVIAQVARRGAEFESETSVPLRIENGVSDQLWCLGDAQALLHVLENVVAVAARHLPRTSEDPNQNSNLSPVLILDAKQEDNGNSTELTFRVRLADKSSWNDGMSLASAPFGTSIVDLFAAASLTFTNGPSAVGSVRTSGQLHPGNDTLLSPSSRRASILGGRLTMRDDSFGLSRHSNTPLSRRASISAAIPQSASAASPLSGRTQSDMAQHGNQAVILNRDQIQAGVAVKVASLIRGRLDCANTMDGVSFTVQYPITRSPLKPPSRDPEPAALGRANIAPPSLDAATPNSDRGTRKLEPIPSEASQEQKPKMSHGPPPPMEQEQAALPPEEAQEATDQLPGLTGRITQLELQAMDLNTPVTQFQGPAVWTCPPDEYLLPPRTISERKLLVVEDDPINQKIIRALVQKMGYQKVTFASDGADAIFHYNEKRTRPLKLPPVPEGATWKFPSRSAAISDYYDVVLLDQSMPTLSGDDTCRLIRKGGDRTQVIISCSANTQLYQDAELRSSLGYDDAICKPLFLETLREILTRWHTAGDARRLRHIKRRLRRDALAEGLHVGNVPGYESGITSGQNSGGPSRRTSLAGRAPSATESQAEN